jgi:hypothetical protein
LWVAQLASGFPDDYLTKAESSFYPLTSVLVSGKV